MNSLIEYFENGGAYSVERIGGILDRSANYATGKLTGVDYECTITSEAGPESKAWSGRTLNTLVAQGRLTKRLAAGSITWVVGSKPKGALDHVNQMTIK
jgi:hypothetical protein